MRVTIFDQPYPLVTLEEAKVALGEDSDHRNQMISGLIMAAQGEMDGPNGWLGMSVAVQGLEYRQSSFETSFLLPYGPVTGEAEIRYLDADGVEQIVDDTFYTINATGQVSLVSGAAWPDGSEVSTRYYAGISDSFDPRIQMLKTAILLHVRMTMDGIDAAASRRAIEAIVRPLWVATC